MTYSPTTRIGSKYSDHPTIGHPDLIYGYDINGLTHQPRVIYDFYSHNRLQLYWDRNGNLRQIQPSDGYARFHLWDDDNMLVLSVGPTTCGYYGNASDGKRAYKMFGDFFRSSVNGGNISGMAYFGKTVLYPNQYMTLSITNYTKHYFMGNERFCTTIGGGNDGNWLVPLYDNLTQQEQGLLTTLRDDYTYQHTYYDIYDYGHYNNQTHNTDYTGTVESGDQLYDYYQYNSDEQYYGNISFEFKQPFADDFDKYYKNDEMDEPYYYHSDHLGSAAWITDAKGLPAQYIMYAPYGEQRLNQQPFAYEERFTFTGKERDAETGYDYFGARCYIPFVSTFGSPDPLSNKNIPISSYAYCNGNPIKFIDPDGCDTKDKVIGFSLGVLTSFLPGSYYLRDVYSPTSFSDYNSALEFADNMSFTIGTGMLFAGESGVGAGTSIVVAGGVTTASVIAAPEGAAIMSGGGLIVVGSEAIAMGGIALMANATINKSLGYSRGASSKSSPKSINQLQQDVKTGNAPKGIERFDKGKFFKEQDHVHFDDGSALNKDGTWKHGKKSLTNDQKQYLKENGWNIE